MKRYLGDGVYVDFDGFAILLTTENGLDTTNAIILEPETIAALDKYIVDLTEVMRLDRERTIQQQKEIT